MVNDATEYSLTTKEAQLARISFETLVVIILLRDKPGLERMAIAQFGRDHDFRSGCDR